MKACHNIRIENLINQAERRNERKTKMAERVKNYTEEMVAEMTKLYTANPNRETVDALANKFGKTVRSIIAKLSREGVYEKTEYLTKTGEKPVTKRELVEKVAEILAVEYQALAGLEKSPKQNLKSLVEALILTLKPEEWESYESR